MTRHMRTWDSDRPAGSRPRRRISALIAVGGLIAACGGVTSTPPPGSDGGSGPINFRDATASPPPSPPPPSPPPPSPPPPSPPPPPPAECAPGTKRCSGDMPQSCDAAGAWQDDGASCGGPTFCEQGACKPIELVKAALDRHPTIYAPGDQVSVTVQANVAGYVEVQQRRPDGTTATRVPDTPVAAGVDLTLGPFTAMAGAASPGTNTLDVHFRLALGGDVRRTAALDFLQTHVIVFEPDKGAGASYQIGDSIGFNVLTTRSGYLEFLVTDPSGSATLAGRDVAANVLETISGPDDRNVYSIAGPGGANEVRAILRESQGGAIIDDVRRTTFNVGTP